MLNLQLLDYLLDENWKLIWLITRYTETKANSGRFLNWQVVMMTNIMELELSCAILLMFNSPYRRLQWRHSSALSFESAAVRRCHVQLIFLAMSTLVAVHLQLRLTKRPHTHAEYFRCSFSKNLSGKRPLRIQFPERLTVYYTVMGIHSTAIWCHVDADSDDDSKVAAAENVLSGHTKAQQRLDKNKKK